MVDARPFTTLPVGDQRVKALIEVMRVGLLLDGRQIVNLF